MTANIVRLLTSRGTFVITPAGRFGMVRRFDRRTNEALVQYGATGLIDALAGRGVLSDKLLVDRGMAIPHHFSTLRLAPKKLVAQAQGVDPRGVEGFYL